MSATPLPPLYVDLDGTLIATDLLHESMLKLFRASPVSLLRLPFWLMRGKAYMKRRIAERVEVDPQALPYRQEVLETIQRAREQGRRVVLATASDTVLAKPVAEHLGVFDGVIGSDGAVNLSGERKLEAIRRDAGGQPFSYAGDRPVDLDVWRGAASAVVVSASKSLRRRASAVTQVAQEIDVPGPTWRQWLYGLRLHQWLKNLLVFVPVLPIMNAAEPQMWLAALSMFFAFGLCASAIYVFNDLLDLEADRQHKRKRKRPFASGAIPISQGIVAGILLLIAAAVLAVSTLPWIACATLVGYVALTTAYSVWLKRRMLVDVFTLAALYTSRILAGGAAIEVAPSFWLLGLSVFMFLSLALAKRYVEIRELRASGRSAITGRAYHASDDVFVLATGVGAGQLSILTLSIYLNDPIVAEQYVYPYVLWLLCPLLLYWLVRIWLKAHRGQMHDDPLVFAATDRVSRMIILLSLVIVVIAT